MEDRQYKPPIGDFTKKSISNRGDIPTTYADINALKRGLETLIKEVNAFNKVLETKMSSFALSVDPSDPKLVSANENEWPKDLGEPKSYISYDFYKALKFSDTTSSFYIRNRYEEAARDITGASALDMIELNTIMQNEAVLIQDFLINYIGNANDSAEYRTIEQFQDWLISAVGFKRQFQEFFKKGETNPQFVLPAEIRNTSSQEAKQGQAFFRVKLNAKNDAIEKDLQFLKRNFSEYAGAFYTQHLGPALGVHLKVIAPTMPIGGKINNIVAGGATQMDGALNHALTDQMRRRVLFEEKVESIYSSIQERDTYRSYIQQLAHKGKALPTTGQRIMVQGVELTPGEVQHFNAVTAAPSTPGFISSHSKLFGLDQDDHPQYLLKSGGTITGEIAMDLDARIDGIKPSSHTHTGLDGSLQIHGSSIIEGTLVPSSVDNAAKPPKPSGIDVISYSEVLTATGVVLIDVIVQWDGVSEYLYDVQVAKVE